MATEISVNRDREIVEQALRGVLARYPPPPASLRVLPVFDNNTGNYLLMDEGWDGYKRVHRVWLHVELRDGKFFIHEDETQEGIANDLIATGVATDRIVLSWNAPNLRAANGLVSA